MLYVLILFFVAGLFVLADRLEKKRWTEETLKPSDDDWEVTRPRVRPMPTWYDTNP